MDVMSGFDFKAELFSIFLIEILNISFFAIIFGFVAILFVVFRKPYLLIKRKTSS